jgi:Ca2+-binding RTX toxin-like protein
MTKHEGDDLLDGRGGSDVASFAYAERGVTVRLEDSPGSGHGHAGGEGRDTLIAIEGAVGSAHNDVLSGSAGANWLSGGGGNDTLLGLAGDDQLFGGEGDDRLEGGAGGDLLVGGLGSDLFIFGPGSGTDQIRGFEPGVDRVQLSGTEPANFDDFQAAFDTTAADVTIQLEDGSSLSLVGIAASQLAAGDFQWA